MVCMTSVLHLFCSQCPYFHLLIKCQLKLSVLFFDIEFGTTSLTSRCFSPSLVTEWESGRNLFVLDSNTQHNKVFCFPAFGSSASLTTRYGLSKNRTVNCAADRPLHRFVLKIDAKIVQLETQWNRKLAL